MKNHSTFRLSLIAAALTAVYGPALAADANDEVRQFASPDSRIGIGVGNISGDNQQLGKYNGLSGRKSDTSLLVDTDVRMRDDATGTWTTLTARNVGRENAEFNVGYGQQGNWGASFDFNQISSENPLTFITGVRGIGSSTLQYGTPGINTAAAQAGLYPANNEVHLGTKRDISKLNISKELMPDLTLNFSFRNDSKTGTQLWGRGVNPEFAVQPIDTKIQQADLILNYVTKDLQLMGGISGSWFSNAHSYVDTIGGSQTTALGANQTMGHTFLSLPLDNQAYSVFLDGGYNFSKDTRASFKMSWQRATQDDSLSKMAGAINASGALGTSAVLPVAPHSLNGEVDTTTLNVGIVSRLMDKLTVSAKYDYNKRDDQTPTSLISPTAVAGGQYNNPESFKKDSLRIEGIYRLPDGYSLTGGYDEEWREHDLAFANDGAFEGTVKMRRQTDEKTWRLQLRKAMSETLTGSLSYLHSKRDGTNWNPPETEVTAIANQGAVPYTDASSTTTAWTNPFAFANRTRNKWRLMADWSPLEKVSLQFVYENSKDDYSSAKSGLQEGKGELFSVDATVALDDNWQLNGWGSHDFSKANQRVITYDPRTANATGLRDAAGNLYGAVANPAIPGSVGWLCSSANVGAGQCTTDLLSNMNLKDTGNNVGFNLKGKLMANLTVGLNAQWTETKSEYPTNSNVPLYNTGTNAVLGTAASANRSKQGLPDITNTTTKIGLFGEYAVQKDSDIRLDVIHTRFKTDDWTFSEWNSAGSGLVPLTYMDGTKAYQKSVQSAYFIGARYTYKFQ